MKKDLALLVADKDMEMALGAALGRAERLFIRALSCSVLRHPYRDGGVRSDGVSLISLQRRSHSHAMLVFDLAGSGADDMNPLQIENILNEQLRPLWGDNARAIVIEPELDVWMWGNDDLLRDVLKWPESTSLREWLRSRGFAVGENGKPSRPKEAMEAVMSRLQKPRSSALYGAIAGRVSLARCTDPAFVRLRQQLQIWFPPKG